MSSVQPIEVKLFANDHNKLKILADSVASIIANVRGTADVFDGIVIAGPEVDFNPKAANLYQYNLTPADLQFQLQTKIEGTIPGSILEPNQLINIRLMENRQLPSINKLQQSFIFLNNGKLKPIEEFTDINLKNGVAEIDRENLKPMIAVTARLNQRDLGSTLNEIKSKINSNINLPKGYQIVYGGSYAQQQQAFSELLIILVSAILLVFIVILFLFRNIKISFAIIFIAVLGIAGSLIALYITGTPLNVGSYTGIIMIIGIIGENSIFTFLQYHQNRENNSIEESIIDSISTRIRPNLMTAFGAIIALLPLALGIGSGAQMHQPLAIAIIGGFILAIPLLLIVLPTILRIIER